MTPRQALCAVLDEEHADAVIEHRRARNTVKPFDLYRAKLVVKQLCAAHDLNAAFWEMTKADENKECLTVEYLRAVYHYDPETGIFVRRKTGEPSGSLHCQGYTTISVAGRSYLAHRLAWFYVTGSWPTDQIDHINRNRSDNRFSNLRECSNRENCWNMDKELGRSGVRGVHWDRRAKIWCATIRINGKTTYLGRFKSKQSAGEAYRAAEARHRGHFLEAAQ